MKNARSSAICVLICSVLFGVFALQARAETPSGGADIARYEVMADTFLESRDFTNAMTVIRKGLSLNPASRPMKLRLARLLEWTGDPAGAYPVWKELAAAGNAEAAAAVARLAQSVGDSATHLALLQQAMRAGGMRAADVTALAQAYEYYGKVDEGIAFFRATYAAGGNREVLAALAFLLEQKGDLPEALRLHREHLERFGFDRDRAVRVADLLFVQGRWRDSYAELQRIPRSDIPPSHRFWDLYASMAWELQQSAEAEEAYRMLLSRKDFTVESAERLGFLVFRRSPQEAAEIVMSVHRTKPDVKLMTLAVQYYVTARAFDTAQRQVDLLSPEVRGQYERDNAYVMAAGLVASGMRNHGEALRLYRLALRRSPDDPSVREAVLWTLIEQRNLRSLARALGAWQDDLKVSGRYYLVLASACSALNRYDEARRYYYRYLQSVPDDLSLRLTHADMFDQISRPDIQTRLKSDLFRTVMRRYQDGTLKPGSVGNDILLGQLSLAFMPNNMLADYFEKVRKRNESVPRPDYALHELWLTWAINAGHEEAALRMMRKWETSVSRDANPLWGKLLLALKRKDIDAAGMMLDRDYRLLPRWDRIDAAREAGQYPLAQEMAFETMSAPNNDQDHETHERFVSLMTQHWNEADVQLQYTNRDTLHSFEVRSSYLFRVLNDWWFQPWASTSRLTIKDTELYLPGHVTDRRAGMHLIKKSPQLDLDLNVYARDAWKSFVGAEFSLVKRYNESFSAGIGLGRNAASDVSEPLIIAGMRDYARADVTYTFSHREFLTAAVTAERLMLQDRSSLGSAMRYEFTIGHRFRIEYPDITVRVPMQYYKTWPKSGIPVSASGLLRDAGDVAPDFFVPKSNKQIGIGIDYGVSVRDRYSKDWRPFFTAEYAYNDVNRASATFSGGIVGSVSGRDRLMISAERGVGKGFATPASQITMHYTVYF